MTSELVEMSQSLRFSLHISRGSAMFQLLSRARAMCSHHRKRSRLPEGLERPKPEILRNGQLTDLKYCC